MTDIISVFQLLMNNSFNIVLSFMQM